jgi:hypothetical protein
MTVEVKMPTLIPNDIGGSRAIAGVNDASCFESGIMILIRTDNSRNRKERKCNGKINSSSQSR